MDKLPYEYVRRIAGRSLLGYYVGYFVRLYLFVKYAFPRLYARWHGAQIGGGTIITWKLARRANSNLVIGDDCCVEASDFDLRGKVFIGDHCIINRKVEIIRVSHYIDNDRMFTTRYYEPLRIGNYSWLATGCKILPSCSNIGENCVIGAYSVCVKDTLANGVYSGFPAKQIKEKKCKFDELVVVSLMGGDFLQYRSVIR